MKYEPPIEDETNCSNALNDDIVVPPLKLDPDEFREGLAEFELTSEQENEFLEVLWNILSTMVDIGWGVDTVQMFLPNLIEFSGQDSDNSVKLDHSETFNQSTVIETGKGES